MNGFQSQRKDCWNRKILLFTNEMVHVENSPGYQTGVMELFRVVAEFLDQFGDEFSDTLYADVKRPANLWHI